MLNGSVNRKSSTNGFRTWVTKLVSRKSKSSRKDNGDGFGPNGQRVESKESFENFEEVKEEESHIYENYSISKEVLDILRSDPPTAPSVNTSATSSLIRSRKKRRAPPPPINLSTSVQSSMVKTPPNPFGDDGDGQEVVIIPENGLSACNSPDKCSTSNASSGSGRRSKLVKKRPAPEPPKPAPSSPLPLPSPFSRPSSANGSTDVQDTKLFIEADVHQVYRDNSDLFETLSEGYSSSRDIAIQVDLDDGDEYSVDNSSTLNNFNWPTNRFSYTNFNQNHNQEDSTSFEAISINKESTTPPPKLPRKTFNQVSMFGCDLKSVKNNSKQSSCTLPRGYSVSASNHFQPTTTDDSVDSNYETIEFVPRLTQAASMRKANTLSKTLPDNNLTANFLSALVDLETKLRQTQEQVLSTRCEPTCSKVNYSSESSTSEDNQESTVATAWRYSSLSTRSRSKLNTLPTGTVSHSERRRSTAAAAVAGIPLKLDQDSSKWKTIAGKPPKNPTLGLTGPKKVHHKSHQQSRCRQRRAEREQFKQQQRVETSSSTEEDIINAWTMNVAGTSSVDRRQSFNDTKLVQELEFAIGSGQHRRAAILARELALRKVNCTLIRNRTNPPQPKSNPIVVPLYIEGQSPLRGPIPVQVHPCMSVKMLKKQIEKDFHFPVTSQKWILGKSLASNEDTNLESYGIRSSGTPLFLYIGGSVEKLDTQPDAPHIDDDHTEFTRVEDGFEEAQPDNQDTTCQVVQVDQIPQIQEAVSPLAPIKVVTSSSTTQKTYQELLDLDEVDCVPNTEPFDCTVCFSNISTGNGVVLRDCLHTFCKECLRSAIEYTEEAEVHCPYRDDHYSCESCLQQREIKALAGSELYEKHLQRSMVAAESKSSRSFHCKSPDCPGWCEYEDNVNLFQCPVCGHQNCLTCQTIHENMNCKQYQDQVDLDANENEDARKTKEYLDTMLTAGEAMRCPQCMVIVMKKWGCDWVKCSMCQTEICWVTKGPRWGPAGKGDTSAGCKCMLNGVRCHPKCNYCH